MRDLVIRHCEPEDYKAVHLIYSSPRAMAETLGVPYSSEDAWREELARERDDNFSLVACVQSEVVGHLALSVYMNPRTRHSGHLGIAVRDDWQLRPLRAWQARKAFRTESELARRTLRQVAHNGAQSEISRQVRGEAADTEGLAGVELYLASGEVREDGAGGVDPLTSGY